MSVDLIAYLDYVRWPSPVSILSVDLLLYLFCPLTSSCIYYVRWPPHFLNYVRWPLPLPAYVHWPPPVLDYVYWPSHLRDYIRWTPPVSIMSVDLLSLNYVRWPLSFRDYVRWPPHFLDYLGWPGPVSCGHWLLWRGHVYWDGVVGGRRQPRLHQRRRRSSDRVYAGRGLLHQQNTVHLN